MRRRAASLLLGTACFALGAVRIEAQQEQRPRPAPIEMLSPQRANPNAPIAIGTEDDVYCSGWLGGLDEAFAGRIISAELVDSKSIFLQGDVMYLDIGAEQGVAAGQEFWICRPGRVVYKWGSVLDELGRVYDTPGRIRIICALEKSSIAEITHSCLDVEVGDVVLPFEPIPIPLVRRARPLTSCDTPNGKPTGHVVDSKNQAVPVGAGSIVFLDLGEQNGLAPGDFLTVYRYRSSQLGLRTILGEAAILKATDRSSVAIVTMMNDTIYVGDEVEVK